MNVANMIKQLGGVAVLRRKLEAEGTEITYKGIEKWRERNKLPSAEMLITLQGIASNDGVTLDLA